MKQNKYNKDLYEVSPNLSFLFGRIYGDSEYYDFKENARFKEYRVKMVKLIKTLRKTYTDSLIETDSYHRREILDLLDKQAEVISLTKDLDNLLPAVINCLTQLSFLLLGMLPDYSSREKALDQRSNWQANRYRKVVYSQTREQRILLLTDLLKKKTLAGFPTYKEVIDSFVANRVAKEEFLDWFKRTYPVTYLEIFSRTP